MEFTKLQTALAKKFEELTKKSERLVRLDVEPDKIWEKYLKSFPEGSNPIFRERTGHDCSCCKQFIRSVGNVAGLVDGKVVSIWDFTVKGEPEYQEVVDALSKMFKKKSIRDEFRTDSRSIGAVQTFEELIEDGRAGGQRKWNHFHLNIPNTYVLKRDMIPTILGETRTNVEVYRRGLNELTLEAIDSVLELIDQNSLYRGQEHRETVAKFRVLKAAYAELKTEQERDAYVWSTLSKNLGVTLIRNTVIGTLLIDLSADKELEDAVKAFEFKVAPSNYKRPTALVSKAMIDKAKKKLEELGLLTALERRYAVIEDISVNNVLFVDRSVRPSLGGASDDIFDVLPTKKTKPNLDRVEEISIEKFIANVLPKAKSVSVFLENSHSSNLVSLIGPKDPTAGKLFKWDNQFSWSYKGELADSMKERVKKAGGKIVGDLLCRLAWDYSDDLDFHLYEPGGAHINYARRRSMAGGHLDVDANGMDGIRENPVENIVYESKRLMPKGDYTLEVMNFSRRSEGRDFEVEVEFAGEVHRLKFEGVLRDRNTVDVGVVAYDGKEFKFKPGPKMQHGATSRTMWNLDTQKWHAVQAMMLSPNYWDDQRGIGNKHYMFMLAGCTNDEPTRGFFNEFLSSELNEHRKVLEMVGSKLKAASAEHQLSGLGFSETQRNSILCKVEGSITRTVKVVF